MTMPAVKETPVAQECAPGCLVCERARDLPDEGRECLHRLAHGWNPDTFGGWGGFVVTSLAAAWRDGEIVGRHKARPR